VSTHLLHLIRVQLLAPLPHKRRKCLLGSDFSGLQAFFFPNFSSVCFLVWLLDCLFVASNNLLHCFLVAFNIHQRKENIL
jgi:hypothetical protein